MHLSHWSLNKEERGNLSTLPLNGGSTSILDRFLYMKTHLSGMIDSRGHTGFHARVIMVGGRNIYPLETSPSLFFDLVKIKAYF